MKARPDTGGKVSPHHPPSPKPRGAWSLRPAVPEDLGAVRALLEAARLPTDGVENRFPRDYAVAEKAGALIAAVGMERYGRYGLVRSLAVAPGWRGRRIGRALVEDRLAWARSRGLISVFLITLTPAYFVPLGFRPVRRDSVPPEIRSSREFSTVCPETADIMALPIAYADEDLRAQVRAKYADIARRVEDGPSPNARQAAACCGGPGCGASHSVGSTLYTFGELDLVPEGAALASLGCGNPTALAELRPGEVVLDLGSGGGIDVLLAARRVGPTGRVYGLDMTDAMLGIARGNQRQAGVTNVEFLKGEIEAIPLSDESVDVVISNCVINLSTDKRRVFSEAYRVLKPGGRFAVSDIVARGPVPEAVRRDVELWAGCVAGSLEETEYRRLLREVGFEDVAVEPTRVHRDAAGGRPGTEKAGTARSVDGMFMSAFVRAARPAHG